MAHVHNAHTRPGVLNAVEWVVCKVCDLLRAWVARRRQRSAMLMLEKMDRHRLRDVGLEHLAKHPQNPYTQQWRNHW